ncbi:MAG: PmoA family protein [Planctomycetota bacterium]|nr:PmoA family protein [Planctomycetota bacterium]MDA1213555.1 PmoA family protein [Planctomycetota bacterium]
MHAKPDQFRVYFALLSLVLVNSFFGTDMNVWAGEDLKLRISAGEHDRAASPVSTVIILPSDFGTEIVAEAKTADGNVIAAQVTGLSLLDKEIDVEEGFTAYRLWLDAPAIAAGQSLDVIVTKVEPGSIDNAIEGFHWQDEAGQHTDLFYGERAVMRYQYAAYVSEDDKRDLNNKPFHHLFDSSGKLLVTKGSGGFYTHHQGLFYGFTRITRDGMTSNLWYCHDGEYQSHEEVLEEISGPVMGRHRVRITWRNQQGEPLCNEIREMTAFHAEGGTLVQFASTLSSAGGTLILDGDPQHAGFQFRAADEVAVREKENLTYYLRVDGKGTGGETRNYPDDPSMKDLPWNAMSFVLGERWFTAVYLDHPQNPKPSFYSERTYGRFGSWFGTQTLEEEGPPVAITYRIWLQDGEMTVDAAQALSNNFATPPKVEMVNAK